jgi:hypothetical protein
MGSFCIREDLYRALTNRVVTSLRSILSSGLARLRGHGCGSGDNDNGTIRSECRYELSQIE